MTDRCPLRWAAIAACVFAIFACVAPSADGHRLSKSPYSTQLIHKIDHARERVRVCAQARGIRGQLHLVQRPYRPAGVPVAYRELVLTYWRGKARSCERHVLPFTNDWRTAVKIVQRPFPGTEGWLLSCSAAESRHGSWVWNGSAPLAYRGQLRGDRAGGYLQFRYSTYDAHDDAAFAAARRRGYAVPVLASYWDATGQAVVGGFMRWAGIDNSHWSASWGRGC